MMNKRSSSQEGPSTLEVLRNKEQRPCYQCKDYLKQLPNDVAAVDVDARFEMTEWLFKVTAFLKLDQEIAITSAALLDRFLQTQQGEEVLRSIKDYRLYAITSLYMTAKINSSFFISSEVCSALSHGLYTQDLLEHTEMAILKAMDWHVNVPTPAFFCQEFLNILPCSVSQKMRTEAYELCLAQVKKCMLDYNFISTEASTIAFYSVYNALQSLGMDSIVLGHVAKIFSYATHTEYALDSIKQELMFSAVALSMTSTSFLNNHPRQQSCKKTRSRSNSLQESPTSVVQSQR